MRHPLHKATNACRPCPLRQLRLLWCGRFVIGLISVGVLVEGTSASQCTERNACPEGLSCCSWNAPAQEHTYPADCAEVCFFAKSAIDECANEETWPDLDHELVCGDCAVLVHHLQELYKGKCSNYCATLGKDCLGAWEEELDTCHVTEVVQCDVRLARTSDAICQCAPDKFDIEPWFFVDVNARKVAEEYRQASRYSTENATTISAAAVAEYEGKVVKIETVEVVQRNNSLYVVDDSGTVQVSSRDNWGWGWTNPYASDEETANEDEPWYGGEVLEHGTRLDSVTGMIVEDRDGSWGIWIWQVAKLHHERNSGFSGNLAYDAYEWKADRVNIHEDAIHHQAWCNDNLGVCTGLGVVVSVVFIFVAGYMFKRWWRIYSEHQALKPMRTEFNELSEVHLANDKDQVFVPSDRPK